MNKRQGKQKKKNIGGAQSGAEDLGKTIQEDPLMEYGFGVVAYRNILKYMCVGFTVLSLLQLPIIYAYGSGTGFDIANSNAKHPSPYTSFTLGNLGYATSKCD